MVEVRKGERTSTVLSKLLETAGPLEMIGLGTGCYPRTAPIIISARFIEIRKLRTFVAPASLDRLLNCHERYSHLPSRTVSAQVARESGATRILTMIIPRNCTSTLEARPSNLLRQWGCHC